MKISREWLNDFLPDPPDAEVVGDALMRGGFPIESIETPDDGVVPVRADNLEGDARDAAWARFKEASPGFATYESRTTRVIPVLALRRRPA